MTLYELAGDYKKLQADIEALDIDAASLSDEQLDEFLQAVVDTLDGIREPFENKAENIAVMIKTLDAEVAVLKAEVLALRDRRIVKEALLYHLKDYLAWGLETAGVKVIDKPKARISLRTSTAVRIDSPKGFVEWAMENNEKFLRYREPEIDKIAVKQALSRGERVEGATLETRQNVVIK